MSRRDFSNHISSSSRMRWLKRPRMEAKAPVRSCWRSSPSHRQSISPTHTTVTLYLLHPQRENKNFSSAPRFKLALAHYSIFRCSERMENGKILIIINQCLVCALWKLLFFSLERFMVAFNRVFEILFLFPLLSASKLLFFPLLSSDGNVIDLTIEKERRKKTEIIIYSLFSF